MSGFDLGATLYAFTNEYITRTFSFEQLLQQVADRGLGPGIEVVGYQSIRSFPDVDDGFVEHFRSLVDELGLRPTSLGINSDRFLKPGVPVSDADLIASHKVQMRSAARLGFPIVRFQFATPPELLPELAPYAEELGILMGLEVHAPTHARHPLVMRYREVYDRIGSPALGWIPDFGGTAYRLPPSLLQAARDRSAPEGLLDLLTDIWRESGAPHERAGRLRDYAVRDGYAPEHVQFVSLAFFMLANEDPLSWSELVADSIHIHGKFYGVGEDGREEAIDYETILPLFRDGGFQGTMVSEWEGHAYAVTDAFAQVERHQAMCRRILLAGAPA